MFWQEAEPSSKPDDILESTVDAAEWRLEVERVLPQLKVTIRTDNKVETHLNSSEPQPTHSVLMLVLTLVLTLLRFSRTGGSIWIRCISTETESSRHSKTPRWVDPNGPGWFWTVHLVLDGPAFSGRSSWFWTDPAGSGQTHLVLVGLSPRRVLSCVSAELPGQAAGGHRENSGEGEQQREIHQQPAGGADPGIPQRSGPAQRGETQ